MRWGRAMRCGRTLQHGSRNGGAGAGPAMLRLCPKRFLWIHFRKALPCFPLLICSQSVFSHHTGSLLLLLLPVFSKFIFNLVQWLISRRALFNTMRNLFSLDKVFMGKEGFKVAQGGREKKKRQLFSSKEEQHVSTNQKDFCSLRLKTLESPLQGGYPLRENPSSLLPAPPRHVLLWVQMKFTLVLE